MIGNDTCACVLPWLPNDFNGFKSEKPQKEQQKFIPFQYNKYFKAALNEFISAGINDFFLFNNSFLFIPNNNDLKKKKAKPHKTSTNSHCL